MQPRLLYELVLFGFRHHQLGTLSFENYDGLGNRNAKARQSHVAKQNLLKAVMSRLAVGSRGKRRKTRIALSLEDGFWKALKEIATRRHMILSDLIATIEAKHRRGNLSSGIRLFILNFYSEELAILDRREAAQEARNSLTRGRHRLPRAYHQPWVAKSLFHMLMTASAAFSKSTCSAGAVSETIPVRV